jgi:hypothetical protein
MRGRSTIPDAPVVVPAESMQRCVNQGVCAMALELKEAGEPDEPDGNSEPLHFVVGQDCTGMWVVDETHGLYGGIFCSKDAALRFAKFETADRGGDLAMTSERLDFRARRARR